MKQDAYIDLLTKDWKPSAKKNISYLYFVLIGLPLFLLVLETNFKSMQFHPMRLDFIIPYLVFVFGVYAIFKLSAPGQDLKWVLIISIILLLIRTIYMVWNIDWIEFTNPSFYTLGHTFCPSHFAIYGLPILFAILLTFRSKFTTQIPQAATVSIISSFCLAEIILNMFCPDIRFSHLSFWHLLSWVIPITVGSIFNKRYLEW